ncbi:MAG: hypothetical protein QOH42_1186 [Blastocatellia bacterium]|nr:hypothetical protein [Blastocatellia bacterium]
MKCAFPGKPEAFRSVPRQSRPLPTPSSGRNLSAVESSTRAASSTHTTALPRPKRDAKGLWIRRKRFGLTKLRSAAAESG